MKNVKRKLYSKEQLNEIFVALGKAILGTKARALLKVAEKDPGLHDALSAHARSNLELKRYLEDNYNEDGVYDFAKNIEKNMDMVDRNLAKLKKSSST